MPGHTNKKQSQRTKGNVRPSSSSQAAQLLATASPTGFVGFGGSPGYVPASQAFDDVDSTLDADFRMILRKLTKKDSTTKVKALQEFSSLCEDKDIEHLKAVLPFWPRIYNKVALDVDHKVRECTQQAMNTLVLRVRKNLAPYLKSVMGSWLLCQCDTYPTVASAAQQAFQTAFPSAKQTDALIFCKSVITEYLIDNLLNQTPSTLSDGLTTEEGEMVNKYNRVLTSSLLAIRKLIISIPANQIEDLKEPLRTMLKDGKFWKHGKTVHLQIKSAMYTFLAGLCQTMPDIAQEFSKKLSPFILNNIDERDPVICPAVWESVLSLVSFVSECWADVSVEKSVWPKLRKMLENGCYGNCSLIAPDLLPFISKVPPDILKEENKFYLEFLNYMKLGLSKEQVLSSTSECSSLVRAFVECLQFVMNEVSNKNDMNALKIILQDQLLPVVISSVVEKNTALYKSPLYSMMGNAMGKLEKMDNVTVVDSYWSELLDKIKERLDMEVESESMAVVERVIFLVKSFIFPQVVSKVKIEKVKFSDEKADENIFINAGGRVALTKGMIMFVQKLTIHAFQNAHKQWNPPSLHLFAGLVELEPTDQTIRLVIECCHGDVSSDQSHSNYFVFNVCLPWLHHAQSQGQSTDLKQLISVICTFIELLDNSSLAVLLKTLTETVESFEAFYHLLTKCVKLQAKFSSIKEWLHSDTLCKKLVEITTVVCNESTKSVTRDGVNIQYGWDIISLVLTVDQNSDQVISEEHIKQILQIVHNTLLSLGDNSEPNNADVAVSFVSKATHSFFLSSNICLLLPSAEDLLITLFTLSLDNGYGISDEILKESEVVWMTGLGSIVRQTGGLYKDGGLLHKTVEVVKNKLMKVENLYIFERIMTTVDRLLTVVRESLAQDKGENSVVNYLIHRLYFTTENVAPRKVLQYFILKDHLTYLSIKPGLASEFSFTQSLFSALYNVRLLCLSKFKTEEQGTSTTELGSEEIQLFLSVLHSMNVVNQWKEMNSNVCRFQTLTESADKLMSSVTSVVQQLTDNTRKYLLTAALDSAAEKGSFWCLAVHSLLSMYTTDFTLDFNLLLDRCSELDESRVQVLQVAAPYLTTDNKQTLGEIMVARMMSAEPLFPVNGGIQALAVLNSVVMEISDLENCRELIQAALTQMLTWKEDNDALLLYSSDISQSGSEEVFANVEMMKFLQKVVTIIPGSLSDKEWDFIMCSVVSFVQSIEESVDQLKDSVEVQIFTCSTCRLLATVAKCLQADIDQSAFPLNLVTEWNEFFSEGIYGTLLPLYLKVSVEYNKAVSGQMFQLLHSMSLSVCQCPKQQVLDHKLPAYLRTDDTSNLPDSLQTLLNHVTPLLSHSSVKQVQLSAFHLIYSIVPDLPQYEKESTESEEEEVSRCPQKQLMSVLSDCSTIDLSGLSVEEYLKVHPSTKEYTITLSYLLTWRLLLYLFRNSTPEIRQEYAIYFRQFGLVHQLLSNIFRLMPDNPTLETKVMFEKNFKLNCSDNSSSKDIQYLACSVYRHALQTVPAMVRQWWKEQDRKTLNYIDRFTSKFVSPILCIEEIQPVSKTDIQLNNITIKTRPITREVIATYALEEVTIEMVIALPENYPLGTITVVSEKRVGVSAQTWDKWLLQLNVFLQYQNGSIVDGLRIWKRNIDKRFEGVEDCMICYSVIHGTTYQLPRLTCKTCKKKFHSACLYKWFQTSHNSTCPLCRNLF